MSYLLSIYAVVNAENRYYYLCGEYGEDDGITIEAFIELESLKEEHTAKYGPLVRINGQLV